MTRTQNAPRYVFSLTLILALTSCAALEGRAQSPRDGKAQLQRAQLESMPYVDDPAEQAFAAGVREAIKENYSELSEAMREGSAERTAMCYAPDAMLFAAGERPIQGRGAIKSLFARLVASGAVFHRVPIDVERHGDVAYEYGKLTVRGAEGEIVAVKPYVVLWKKMSGTWRMHRDFVSGTRP